MSVKYLLKDFKLPKEIEFHSNEDANEGIFEVEPFERGYGTTVGNMFRRTILSSIQGYAVSALRINYGSKFLSSEYESIPGILDDSLEIVDRIKQLKFIIDSEGEVGMRTVLRGEFKGKGKCKASIFENSLVSILNKDDVIFEATEEVDLFFELEVELGRGYVPSEITENRIEEEGTISIDAIFSPIENVKYKVEDLRIGHRSDYEKLILTVTTDGTITPVDVVAQAAKLIKENMTIFINFNEDDVEMVTEDETKILELKKLLSLSIDELELSSRSYNCLRSANILTIESLVKLSEREIQGLPNFGNKSMDEIQAKLAELDFSLGMELPAEVLSEKR